MKKSASRAVIPPQKAIRPNVPSAAASKLRDAFAFFQQGQLAQAEALYNQVLQEEQSCFDALYLLGVITLKRGQAEEAANLISRAIAVNPRNAIAHFYMGLALQSSGRLEEAVTSYDSALQIRPEYVDALNNRGGALYGLRRFEDAVGSYDRVLKIKPDYVEALNNRGIALYGLDRFEEAIASYDQALKIKPDYADALNNRGLAFYRLDRFDDAVGDYNQALQIKPDYAGALNNRGMALCELGRFEEAMGSYDRALQLRPVYAEALRNRGKTLDEIDRHEEAVDSFHRALQIKPDDAEALCNLGNVLRKLDRLEDAMSSCDRALQIRPDYADALHNRGMVLRELKRHEEALENYDRALQIKPGYANALNNRGIVLYELNRLEEAIDSYDRALQIRPDHAAAHRNASFCRLLFGEFETGLQHFEWRWQGSLEKKTQRNFRQSLWLGETPLHGKTILLHAEQGLGDTIQFCRYAQILADQGANVLFAVPTRLQLLLSGVAGVNQLFVDIESPPDFDYHCPLLSLPLACKTRLDTIPAHIPYIAATPSFVQKWQDKLEKKTKPRVGIVWSGNGQHANDANRSISLERLRPLICDQWQLVSLQKEVRASDRMVLDQHPEIIDLGGELNDFADTAGLIANLDIVVSVDTSVAHLAGAMGKPVWILLPLVPDWRWLLGRTDSPWYPTARLFRQRARGDWAGVVENVGTALRTLFH